MDKGLHLFDCITFERGSGHTRVAGNGYRTPPPTRPQAGGAHVMSRIGMTGEYNRFLLLAYHKIASSYVWQAHVETNLNLRSHDSSFLNSDEIQQLAYYLCTNLEGDTRQIGTKNGKRESRCR